MLPLSVKIDLYKTKVHDTIELPAKGGNVEVVKSAYICCPLTELPDTLEWLLLKFFDFLLFCLTGRKPPLRFTKKTAKRLYSSLGDRCEVILGVRAFVPHEYFDPVEHRKATPEEVDRVERKQVCELTSVLVVVAIEPSWGGGIEVEMANRSGVPVIILKPPKNISRLLRGNPAVIDIVEFASADQAAGALSLAFLRFKFPWKSGDPQISPTTIP